MSVQVPVPGVVRAVPAWCWIVLAAVAGGGVLAWHAYAQDHDDQDWTMAEADQPPMRAPYPDVPGMAFAARPMAVSDAFRSRSYPDTLASAGFSIIGEF